MGRKFRVVLEVVSNIEGAPSLDSEARIVSRYLESTLGVGKITVVQIDRISSDMKSGVIPISSWDPEPPTDPGGKRR